MSAVFTPPPSDSLLLTESPDQHEHTVKAPLCKPAAHFTHILMLESVDLEVLIYINRILLPPLFNIFC